MLLELGYGMRLVYAFWIGRILMKRRKIRRPNWINIFRDRIGSSTMSFSMSRGFVFLYWRLRGRHHHHCRRRMKISRWMNLFRDQKDLKSGIWYIWPWMISISLRWIDYFDYISHAWIHRRQIMGNYLWKKVMLLSTALLLLLFHWILLKMDEASKHFLLRDFLEMVNSVEAQVRKP